MIENYVNKSNVLEKGQDFLSCAEQPFSCGTRTPVSSPSGSVGTPTATRVINMNNYHGLGASESVQLQKGQGLLCTVHWAA